MSDLYWNRQERSSCLPAAFGLDTCQRFAMHNVTITRNRALYAGGIYATIMDGISISCDPKSEAWVSSTHFSAANADENQVGDYCSYIFNNEISDGQQREGAEAGTVAVSLTVEGWDGPLKQVASGEPLAVPCEDSQNASCSRDLRIAVKDAFDQTIVRGIDDANLEVTLISNAIRGDLRYTAKEGVIVVNKTQAWGVNISRTLRVVSDKDHSVFLELELSTRECNPGELLQDNVCRDCPREQYSFSPSRETCQGCEVNAKCSGGAALVPSDGFWHSTPFSPFLHPCIHRDACNYEGREERLRGYYRNATILKRDLTKLDSFLEDRGAGIEFPEYDQCTDGHEGVLCGSCRSGYGHSSTGACTECPKEKSREAGLIFLGALWLIVLLGINCMITLLSMNSRVKLVKHELTLARNAHPPTLHRARPIRSPPNSAILPRASGYSQMSQRTVFQRHDVLAEQLVATIQLAETLKILMNYLQVTSAALQLQTEWHTLLKHLLEVAAGLAGFSSDSLHVPFECNLDGYDISSSIGALWVRLASPLIALTVLLVCFTVAWLTLQRGKTPLSSIGPDTQNRRTRFVTCVIVICIVSLYFSFIEMVKELLLAISCVKVEKENQSLADDHPYRIYAIEADYQRFWAEDTDLVCFQGDHLPAGIVGIIGLVMAFCGIVLIIVWLPLNKKHVGKTEFIARYWFLYQAYRKKWYTNAWESTILTRKALIAAVVVFSVHLGPTLQASLCAGILVIAHIIQSFLMPFKIPEHHEYVPEYAGDLFETICLPKVASRWVSFNNSVHLNNLESASLASSIVVFFSAIVLYDANCTSLGRYSMVGFAFTVNVCFILFMFYRLYAGIHAVLDLKLEVHQPSFMAAHENGMGLWSLLLKLLTLWKPEERPTSQHLSAPGPSYSTEIPENRSGTLSTP